MVLLDMCLKPRVATNIEIAEKEGRRMVEGIGITGHQVEEQWRLWVGRELWESG